MLFQKLCSAVKYKLFQSYCTSFYGCELWDLACDKMADFCTAWRKVLEEYGMCHQIHTVISFLYCGNVFLCTTRSAGVQ